MRAQLVRESMQEHVMRPVSFTVISYGDPDDPLILSLRTSSGLESVTLRT
jgi:hypothetical protein